ncbi:hypothetical protein ACVNS2_07915 [Paenibacillus caseinilyticus]|uniref:Uncharacterized protein n=1 Tax=Paenibacillus mucilaginosus K02 TaxID=997761 RepID=I0BDZ5_9BACL|nr:hypothetical protein [Paenibacillus mucilaginosus]AFH60592.1 hypothetical protein B2K_07630 [Paenibacillus mucilaginosus K02]
MSFDDILNQYKTENKEIMSAYSVVMNACLLLYPATQYDRSERLLKIREALQDVNMKIESGVTPSNVLREFLKVVSSQIQDGKADELEELVGRV